MNNIKLLIILFLLFNGINNNLSKTISHQRIIGGKCAEPGRFPYQAALFLYKTNDGNSTSLCSGSLITTKFVLTAAHCLIDCWKAQVALGVKSIKNISHSSIVVESTNIQPHKNYEAFGINDIGLVELPQPIKLSNEVTTIKLPLKSERHKTYLNCKALVSGWGLVKAGEVTPSDLLKTLKVEIKEDLECYMYNFDPNQMICGQGKCGRTCLGDSGGPLVITSLDKTTVTQIGIVSFGTTRCTKGVPNIFSRITHYLDWIKRNSDYKF